MKKTVVALSLALIFGMGATLSHAEEKCMYYATIQNQYGAINLDSFDEMQFAQRDGDENKLKELISKNKIKEIQTDKDVCVISEAFYKYSSKISIPGYSKKYWVDSRKLTKNE